MNVELNVNKRILVEEMGLGEIGKKPMGLGAKVGIGALGGAALGGGVAYGANKFGAKDAMQANEPVQTKLQSGTPEGQNYVDKLGYKTHDDYKAGLESKAFDPSNADIKAKYGHLSEAPKVEIDPNAPVGGPLASAAHKPIPEGGPLAHPVEDISVEPTGLFKGMNLGGMTNETGGVKDMLAKATNSPGFNADEVQQGLM